MNEGQQADQEAIPGGVDSSFLDRLTEQLEMGAHAGAIFGDPVEREGITVIPVARARWGVGGGAASQLNARGTGTGGGGGVMITPAGFIQICEGQAKFKAIRPPVLIGAVVVGGFALLLSALKTFQLAFAKGGRSDDRRFRMARGRR
jgi:uncharacterized spore protein YtfJ